MSPTALQGCLLLGVFIPLASFVFLAFFGTRLGGGRKSADHAGPSPGEPLAAWVATAAIAIALALAVIVTFAWAGVPETQRAALTQQAAEDAVVWTRIGDVDIEFGVKLDSLTIIMFLMVTLTSTCIHIFSIGYMKGDPRFARFFTYLSLFCFSMLGLIISSSLLFLFIFWELVGVCSYLLIGFWFEKKSASDAAIKAFVVNRIGDFGFMIGLALCFVFLGTLSIDGAAAKFADSAGEFVRQGGDVAGFQPRDDVGGDALFASAPFGVMLATWVGILLFCGAIGKSAQFPLQVWLPDAMEGPTPVSALIHAATMVAAGVYLVARIFVLLTPGAQMFIAVIGCITLTMAALIALVQVDIKRVLAYSTLSQLGYMIFALGIGAWVAALFHLLTHAFFKSLLFLGSGQVIAGCHHEQDMRKMGGLASKMPNTALTFAIAVLAISGAGIPWTHFGIGGFYSKDEILAVAYYRHQGAQIVSDDAQSRALPDARIVPVSLPPAQEQGEAAASNNHAGGDKLPWLLFMLPMAIAYITPFYMGRCYVLTFLGRPRDEHVHEHAHESPMMYGPLLILAAMTLVSGWYLFRGSVVGAAPASTPLVKAIVWPDGVPHALHAALASRVGFAFVVGLLGAWLIYRNGLATAERIRRMPIVRVAYTVAWNKFYFDHVYNFLLLGGTKTLAVICRLFDNWIVDGIVNASAYVTERISRFSGVVLDNMGVDGLVNGVAKVCYALGGLLRGVQTGVVRNYILVTVTMVAGLVILAALGLGETAVTAVGFGTLAVLVLWTIGVIVTSRRKPLTEKRSL